MRERDREGRPVAPCPPAPARSSRQSGADPRRTPRAGGAPPSSCSRPPGGPAQRGGWWGGQGSGFRESRKRGAGFRVQGKAEGLAHTERGQGLGFRKRQGIAYRQREERVQGSGRGRAAGGGQGSAKGSALRTGRNRRGDRVQRSVCGC